MPALMIPELKSDQIPDRAEREVYLALRSQLPPKWTVRYNYTYCIRDGLYVRDGEADFIVAAPCKGLLFLEVKQSHGYDCRKGIWYRIKKDGSEEKAENPFDQATKNKFRIVRGILCRGLGVREDAFPGVYGHAVVYPFGRVAGKLPHSQDPTVMIAYRDMDRLLDRLNGAFAQWGSDVQAARFTDAICAKVTGLLADESRFVAVAAASADEDDAHIECLTRQQYNVFRGILANPRVRIAGKAGSGKTMLALWSAQAAASEGKKVLFLCFNRVLASWLRARYSVPSLVHVRSFHALCWEYAQQASVASNPPTSDPEEAKVFWAEHSPTILDQAITKMGDACKYDVVIVDEGQDFHQDWWLPVQLLLRDPDQGPLYLFYDPDQAGVYGQGQAYPADVNFKFELSENCRNTKRVASYCGKVIQKEMVTFDAAPLGVVPQLCEPAANVDARAALAKKLIQQWIEEGFRASRIAILSPWRRGNGASVLTYLTSVAAVPVEDDPDKIGDWLENRSLWGSTIKSFKGVEADCILLADIPTVETVGFSRSDMYVAASRAKQRLAFVPTTPASQREIQAWITASAG